ncbi:MAG TPA: hypothetical protein VMN56_04045 [Casimicrobiaceae bacterium]|nr:hypothetical protein [Casimicrobiaceae bacterium]
MSADPAYLVNVSSAFVGALEEAEALADSGEAGAPLAELLRHCRELHEIMVEELGGANSSLGEHAGGVLLDLGDRLAQLEKQWPAD